jgi:hypothetical protein
VFFAGTNGPDVTRVKERDNMSRQMVIERISREADKLAIEYNKTKDPGIREKWFKLLKQIPQEPSEYPSSRT